MFDASYFRKTLAKEIEDVGGDPVVELLLISGHVHRVRAILNVADGFVSVEAYQMKGDLAHHRPRFGGDDPEHDIFRVTISYESIAAVVFDPAPVHARPHTGFASA